MNELLAERDGEVLVLFLNRQEKANAINEAMHHALVSQLDRASHDETVKAVVIAAAGLAVFSAGADLKEFAELERGAASRRRRALILRTFTAMIDFGKPMVAAVQAKALGAGCMLALLADEVVMADSAELGMPEIKHGMPSPIGLVIIAARGGMAVARQMVQLGESIDAKKALSFGLVDELAIGGRANHQALARARALARFSGFAFKVNKHYANKDLRAQLQAAAAEADRVQPV